ncbi:MAG: hypothetical protein AAB513_00720 [Patescibacteria group bacterium]
MSTISVPVNASQEEFIKSFVKEGKATNKADVFRKALDRLAREDAIQEVLLASKEPTLKGNLRELMKKIR